MLRDSCLIFLLTFEYQVIANDQIDATRDGKLSDRVVVDRSITSDSFRHQESNQQKGVNHISQENKDRVQQQIEEAVVQSYQQVVNHWVSYDDVIREFIMTTSSL